MNRLLYYEWKKMMLARKGIWLTAVFFLCSAVFLALTDVPANQEAWFYRPSYETCLEQVEGAYSQQKGMLLEEEAASQAQARRDLRALYDAWYGGGLEEDTFRGELAKLETGLSRQQGFEVLYDQYLYVHEDPENRYFLQTNGWEGLLSRETLDFLLLALLLFLAVPVFCEEYSSRMDTLLLTASRGRRNIHGKLLLVFLVVTGICIGYFAIQFGFFAVKYGLPHGDFPIQSLPGFGSGTKDLSLMGAFVLLCALKWSGCLFFAVTILFLSAITKKYALTVFLSTGLVVLPYIGLSRKAVYGLPAPLSYLLGSGFLKGSEYTADYLTGERIAVFEEIGVPVLVTLWAVTAFLCSLEVLAVLKRHKNRWHAPRAWGLRKNLTLLLLTVASVSLGGCRTETEPAAVSIYNLSSPGTYEYGGKQYYYDMETEKLFYRDMESGEVEALPGEPLEALSSTRLWPCIFGSGSRLYYLQECTDGYVDRVGRFASTIKTVRVMEVDTSGFGERIIFERNISSGRSYLGVEVPVGEDWDFVVECRGFFLNRESLFFVGRDVRQVDIRTGRVSILPIPAEDNIAFDGQFIYYMGTDSSLMRYDPAGKQAESLPGIAACGFWLTEEGICFLNRKDQDQAWLCDRDGGNCRVNPGKLH